MRIILFSIIIFIPLFAFRYTSSQPQYSIGDKVRITTRLTQQPYQTNNQGRQTSPQQVINISGRPRLRVYLPRFPEYYYGDKIEVTGIVTKGKRVTYLADAQIKRLAHRELLPEMRNRIIAVIQKALPEPESALVTGMTLGAKEGITPEFFNSLKNSGTLHVVVASGMNVTLLSRMLLNLFVIFSKRKFGIPLAFISICAYVFLIGADAPITRAAIMGTLAFIAEVSGRIYLSWWALFLSGAAMLLFSPIWLTDIGFLLSFAATASILGFYSPIEKYISEKLRYFPKLIKQDFATSLSAQIGVTPILFVAFGQFAPWAPIVNALLLWTVPPIMALGFVGGFLGLLIEPAGKFIILLSYPLVFLFVRVVNLF